MLYKSKNNENWKIAVNFSFYRLIKMQSENVQTIKAFCVFYNESLIIILKLKQKENWYLYKLQLYYKLLLLININITHFMLYIKSFSELLKRTNFNCIYVY